MRLSSEQVHDLTRRLVRSRALRWQTRVDAALPPAQRTDPLARLATLTRLTREALPPDDVFKASELDCASHELALSLKAGAPWRDARAAALLHAGIALGAQWYQDDRLLDIADQLQIDPATPGGLALLLARPHGERFKRAATRAHDLAPGLQLALQRALDSGLDSGALQHLVLVAFAPREGTGTAGLTVLEADEPVDSDDTSPPWPLEAQTFIERERAIQVRAGISDPALARLCLAGDLVLGLGRCVRLLQRWAVAEPRPSLPAIDSLREALNATTRPQR